MSLLRTIVLALALVPAFSFSPSLGLCCLHKVIFRCEQAKSLSRSAARRCSCRMKRHVDDERILTAVRIDSQLKTALCLMPMACVRPRHLSSPHHRSVASQMTRSADEMDFNFESAAGDPPLCHFPPLLLLGLDIIFPLLLSPPHFLPLPVHRQ